MHFGDGSFWGMHFFWWIFWIILLVWFFFLPYRKINRDTTPKDSPLEILQKRYAKGEISKEEYEEAKKTLKE